MLSKLTKHQTKKETKFYTENGEQCKLTVEIRYDDECDNGHNSFAITGSGYRKTGNGRWVDSFGGCCHDEIVKRFPKLKHLIKWHLCDSDGPMHYIANTVYHVSNKDSSGLKTGEYNSFIYEVQASDHVLFISKIFYSFRNWLHRDEAKEQAEQFLQNIKPELNPEIVQVGHGTASKGKEREFDYARSCAIWPDATDEELCSDDLETKLKDRLPALLEEFQKVIIGLGFEY